MVSTPALHTGDEGSIPFTCSNIFWRWTPLFVSLAQLAEQWTVNPLVVGSIPTRDATFFLCDMLRLLLS